MRMRSWTFFYKMKRQHPTDIRSFFTKKKKTHGDLEYGRCTCMLYNFLPNQLFLLICFRMLWWYNCILSVNCENPSATSEESGENLSADTHTTAKMKLLASPECSTPPEPCLDIGTIITPTSNLSNAEKISLLLQHVPPPAVLPTTFSHGCNRKFNVTNIHG